MKFLQQGVAATVMVGPFVDDADGKTPETGLTIAQATVRLYKNGGTAAQKNDATEATHRENGYYAVPLGTTDTGTAGRLRLTVNVSGALPVWEDFMVIPAQVYDSLVLGNDVLQTNALQVSGSAPAADALELIALNAKGSDHKMLVSANAQDLSASLDVRAKTFTAGAITSAAFATDAIAAGALKADAVAKIVAGVLAGVIENGKTLLQTMRLMYAALCGKASGGGTTTVKFRDDADTKDRITATVDANGNRTAITTDVTD